MVDELRIGAKVKDNDPREPNRVMIVHDIQSNKVVLRHPRDSRWRTKIARSRIFADGKPRRSGWSVVP